MRTIAANAPDLARRLVRERSTSGELESTLRHTPPWRYRRRGELREALAVSRRRERQVLHLLGADVPWSFEYWPVG